PPPLPHAHRPGAPRALPPAPRRARGVERGRRAPHAGRAGVAPVRTALPRTPRRGAGTVPGPLASGPRRGTARLPGARAPRARDDGRDPRDPHAALSEAGVCPCPDRRGHGGAPALLRPAGT